jgi:hypothetical protein
MRTVVILPDEVTIKQSRLDELLAVERAHDQYLRATRRMRAEVEAYQSLPVGHWYARCLHRFSELVVEEGRNAE